MKFTYVHVWKKSTCDMIREIKYLYVIQLINISYDFTMMPKITFEGGLARNPLSGLIWVLLKYRLPHLSVNVLYLINMNVIVSQRNALFSFPHFP